MYMVSLLLFGCISIVLGIVFGKAIRREMQTKQCPYCSCRDCCTIGYEITTACRDDEQKTFMCMKEVL